MKNSKTLRHLCGHRPSDKLAILGDNPFIRERPCPECQDRQRELPQPKVTIHRHRPAVEAEGKSFYQVSVSLPAVLTTTMNIFAWDREDAESLAGECLDVLDIFARNVQVEYADLAWQLFQDDTAEDVIEADVPLEPQYLTDDYSRITGG